jgi:hypothetical protein
MAHNRRPSGVPQSAHGRGAHHKHAVPGSRTRSQMGQLPPNAGERNDTGRADGSAERKRRDDPH